MKLLRSKWIPMSMMVGLFLVASYPVRHPKKTARHTVNNPVTRTIKKVLY